MLLATALQQFGERPTMMGESLRFDGEYRGGGARCVLTVGFEVVGSCERPRMGFAVMAPVAF